MAAILGNLIKQVHGKIVTDTIEIPAWDSWTGKHIEPGKFVYNDGHETMKINDRWNAGYDDTRWFAAQAVIPDSLAGKKLYLRLFVGGEALVRINGKIVGGISMGENWIDRDLILLDDVKSGDKLDIEIEATVNNGVFCDYAMAGKKYLTYTIETAQIDAVHEETEQYYYDLRCAYDSLEQMQDKVIYDRVYTAIDESLHCLDFDFDDEVFYDSVPAARAKLNEMLAAIPDAKQGELCMLGHSHLDVAWLWTTRELVRKTARTFSNNLALIKKYPEFKFTQSQAIVYDYMKKYYPDIFEEVKQAVKDGRWEIVGNAWVEADTNLASGESLVRQLLYGREFFMQEFGVCSDTYWLPDCFGFTWALPQIIKRSGMKYFYTAKLFYNATHKFPYSVFNWKSHSGDEVVACVQQQHYEGEYDAKYIKDCWERTNQKDITGKAVGCFGYGDGGGGCTVSMAENSKRYDHIPGMPKARNTFASEFFDGLDQHKEDLPTFNDELYYENHRGTFTSQAFIKKNNRRGEFMFRNAEFLNVLSSRLFGSEYPNEKMEEGWKLLLTNQFHDILPGTSIHEAMEMTREEYAQMNAIGGELISTAMKKLNASITVDGNSVIVWNMNSMPQSGIIRVEVPFDCAAIEAPNGTPCRFTKDGNTITFIAENVPPMGYAVFKACEAVQAADCVTAEKNLLENAKLRVELDEDGNITRLYDKVNDREVLTGRGNALCIFQDKPIHESAWNLELNYQKKRWDIDKADSVAVVEASEVRGVVRVVRSFHKSVITQDLILRADADYVDFDTSVDWHETEKVLKAEFPVSVKNNYASYEIAHGSISRPTHWNYSTDLVRFEVCGHKWADLSEGDYGVSIINDCKYGYDIKDSRMRITLMRAPICPDTVADKGVSTFVYRLYPHAGNREQANTVKYAYELNQPLQGFAAQKQSGVLADACSFVTVDREDVIIDAVKPAQDGNGWIIRMYEAGNKRSKIHVHLNMGDFSKVVECNLMETDEQEIPLENGTFEFFITPSQVRTFRIIE